MEQCPVCYHQLEVRECDPCEDCGYLNHGITHSHKHLETYKIYEVYQGLRLTLCDFCAVDFGSYKPEYFGFTGKNPIAYQNFEFVRDVADPQVVKDKFCPECSSRLPFLKFLSEVRSLNSIQKD
jgi:hypothetical protein